MAGYGVSQEIRLNKPQWEREKERNTHTHTHIHETGRGSSWSWCFSIQIKQQLFIRLLSDRRHNHFTLQTLGRWGSDDEDEEVDQGLVYFLCWTDMNLSFLMVSTLYLTWLGYPILVCWIPWFKIFQHIKSKALGWQDGSDLLTTELVTLMTASFWKYCTSTDCTPCKNLTLQICQEYADVSRCGMQMHDGTLQSNLKIRR